jgi:hypothetical protein
LAYDLSVQRIRPVYRLVQDGQKVWGIYVWGGARERSSFSLDVHSTVFQTESFAILACEKGCIERVYAGEHSVYARIARKLCRHVRF